MLDCTKIGQKVLFPGKVKVWHLSHKWPWDKELS